MLLQACMALGSHFPAPQFTIYTMGFDKLPLSPIQEQTLQSAFAPKHKALLSLVRFDNFTLTLRILSQHYFMLLVLPKWTVITCLIYFIRKHYWQKGRATIVHQLFWRCNFHCYVTILISSSSTGFCSFLLGVFFKRNWWGKNFSVLPTILHSFHGIFNLKYSAIWRERGSRQVIL